MINWKVRFFNKTYWLSLIPAVLLLIQVVCALFGYTLEMGELGNKLMAVVNAVFGALVILGMVTHTREQNRQLSDHEKRINCLKSR